MADILTLIKENTQHKFTKKTKTEKQATLIREKCKSNAP
jgi:hypothetical protein